MNHQLLTLLPSRTGLCLTATGFLLQVKVTDPVGMPLDTMYMENPLTLSLMDREDSSKSMEQTFSLTAGQTEVVWNIPSMTSTNSYLDLRVRLPSPSQWS